MDARILEEVEMTQMERDWKKVLDSEVKTLSNNEVTYRLELVYDYDTLTHKFYLSCMHNNCMLYEHGCFDLTDFHQIVNSLKRIENERNQNS